MALDVVTLTCDRPDVVGRSRSPWESAALARQLVHDGVVKVTTADGPAEAGVPHAAPLAPSAVAVAPGPTHGQMCKHTGQGRLISTPLLWGLVLSNDCLCCTVRVDLVTTVQDLLARRRAAVDMVPFDRILIEASGLASPGPAV